MEALKEEESFGDALSIMWYGVSLNHTRTRFTGNGLCLMNIMVGIHMRYAILNDDKRLD